MTLREHRARLKAGGERTYTFELASNIERLCATLTPHLRKADYTDLANARKDGTPARIVRLLFDAQEQRPMFHVEGTELPLCWNAPKDWEKDYIKYEWGHLLSRNQNAAAADRIENLALYSARCNQHIQTSLDVQELMIYGGIIAQRISIVLTKRRQLFATAEWSTVVAGLGSIKDS
jgi:hypothetical protein